MSSHHKHRHKHKSHKSHSKNTTEEKPDVNKKREPSDEDLKLWQQLNDELSLLKTELNRVEARRATAQQRADRARQTLDKLDAKIEIEKQRNPQAAANSLQAAKQKQNSPQANKSTPPRPSIEPKVATPVVSSPVKSSKMEELFLECKNELAIVLQNVANASNSGSDSVSFGDSARDAMISTKGFLAIVQTMLDESTVSPAVASLIQGASDDTKNSVVQFVRAAKVCFSEDKPVLKTDMVIADAVRRVALNVKTLLTYLQDKLVGHEVVAPVVAPTNEIVEAAVDWDDLDGNGANAEDSENSEEDSIERDRKIAEQLKNQIADELSDIQTPPKTDVSLTEDDMFGDLDDCFAETETPESEFEAQERREQLQRAIDLRAHVTKEQAELNEKFENIDDDTASKPKRRHSRDLRKHNNNSSNNDENNNNSSNIDENNNNSSNNDENNDEKSEDDEKAKRRREHRAKKAAARDEATRRRRRRRHKPKTAAPAPPPPPAGQQWLRVTVLYEVGDGDHSGLICNLELEATKLESQPALTHGWHETFLVKPANDTSLLHFSVKRESSGTKQAMTGGMKALRTLRSKAKQAKRDILADQARRSGTFSTNNSRSSTPLNVPGAGLSGKPVREGTASICVGDVKWGEAPLTRLLPLSSSGTPSRGSGIKHELVVVLERVAGGHLQRQDSIEPFQREPDLTQQLELCRYAGDATANEDECWGALPSDLEPADDDDAQIDLSIAYNTPLRQSIKWPPMINKAASLLEKALHDCAETPVDEPLPLDIEFHNSRYQTFVHVAAEARRADLLRQIYTFFPRVSLDLRDAFGASPLHIAAALNDAECVEVLVEAGATVDNVAPFSGQTPLHFAAQCNATASALALLEAGANVDASDDFGMTPLHHAASRGASAVAQLLINDGHAFVAAETRDGSTASLIAALGGHAKLAALLDDGSGERDNLRGDTLLWAAVCNSDWKQVAQLAKTHVAEGGIDAPQLGAARLSCLQRLFIESSMHSQLTKVVPALLMAGANVNYKSADGKTALHFAAASGVSSVVSQLLNKKADVNAKDQFDNTPLHCAATEEIVKLLTNAGAKVNAVNVEGNTPLHVARSLFGNKVSEALINVGARDVIKNQYGNTAMHLSCVGAPPAGIWLLPPSLPLLLPSNSGGIWLPRVSVATFQTSMQALAEIMIDEAK